MKYNGKDIKVAWLDLDDTIIDFLTNSRRALGRLWAEKAVIHRRFATAEEWRETYEKHNHRLWDLYSKGLVSRSELRISRFLLPLEEGGVSHEEALEAAYEYDTLYLDYLAAERELIPGSVKLLRFLREKGVKVGCLSNGFKDVQFRKIRNCGLEPMFDIVVLSDDIGVNKPDTRLFIHAMERSGFSDPSCHLMIGDNAATDIEGALRSGWEAIQFLRTENAPVHPECVHKASELTSVIDMLTRGNYGTADGKTEVKQVAK